MIMQGNVPLIRAMLLCRIIYKLPDNCQKYVNLAHFSEYG